MAKRSFPFDNSSVFETEWSKMAKHWRTTGVIVEPGKLLDATQFDFAVEMATGRQVKVAQGVAWIEGHYFESTAAYEYLTLESNAGAPGNRVDIVAILVDWTNNTIDFTVVKGGTDGLPPTLPNSSTKFYFPLAEVTISNTDTITSIKDLRVPSTHKTFHNSTVVRRSANSTISPGQTVTLTWDVREIDSARQHDGSGSYITVAEDGQYRVAVSLSVSGTGTKGELVKATVWRKRSGQSDQAVALGFTITDANAVQMPINVTRLINCKKGDQFYVQVTSYAVSQTLTLHTAGMYSPVFTVEKVGPVGYSFSNEY